MEKTEVQVVALSSSESSPGNFVLVLETLDNAKKMAIIIGAFEAQAIAVYMERMELPRPLTHDVFKNALLATGNQVQEVVIYDIIDAMFHAAIILRKSDKETISVDARASDAIALAVRFDCPIYIADAVLAAAAIQEAEGKKSLLKSSLAEYSVEELESLLLDLLGKEDYESATRIRDMINKRKQP